MCILSEDRVCDAMTLHQRRASHPFVEHVLSADRLCGNCRHTAQVVDHCFLTFFSTRVNQ